MLAGGGEACSDIEHLRAQPVLFGQVASDSTLYRTLRGLGPEAVRALLALWRLCAALCGSAAATRRGLLRWCWTSTRRWWRCRQGGRGGAKAGFGFHPMLCATSDGEPLSIMLRRGNAAANNIADHIDVRRGCGTAP